MSTSRTCIRVCFLSTRKRADLKRGSLEASSAKKQGAPTFPLQDVFDAPRQGCEPELLRAYGLERPLPELMGSVSTEDFKDNKIKHQ